MATAVRVALSLSWKRPACICHDQRFTLPFPVGSCFARTLSASRRRENQRYGLNKYSAALCASANSAFSFDVNHLNAESAETQRTAEKEKWLIRIKRIVAQKVEVYWRKLCCTNRLRRAPSVVALASTLSPCL